MNDAARDRAIESTLAEIERMVRRLAKHLTHDEIQTRCGLDSVRSALIQAHVDLLHVDGQI